MPKARKNQVSLEATPYYHVVTRCVRRSFLCGMDDQGNNFEHRKQWIEDKLFELADVFAIDVCAYAIMSNHYHLVVFINKDTVDSWSVDEVIERWHKLSKGTPLTLRYLREQELMSQAELDAVSEIAEKWRERLHDISWFMRFINEYTARKSNLEDNCTGRFWEGRFKSQALLDEQALAACMAYVDLNPIRAKMAETPETSDYTSIKKRCESLSNDKQPKNLAAFIGNPRKDMPKGLPFKLTDYIELVDVTGRCIREDKRGYIPTKLPPILERLNIETKHWLYLTQNFESNFKQLVGTAFKIKQTAQSFGYQRTPSLNQAIKLTS